MNPVEVVFIYDEAFRKWVVEVRGCVSDTEARQAFSAAIITAQEVPVEYLRRTIVEAIGEGVWRVTPAV